MPWSRLLVTFTLCLYGARGAYAQANESLGDWFQRAIDAPALQRLDAEDAGQKVDLKSEVLGVFPEVDTAVTVALTVDEIAQLSTLLTTLSPTSGINANVFLDRLTQHYTWDDSTRDQLTFIQMMYASPPPPHTIEHKVTKPDPDFWERVDARVTQSDSTPSSATPPHPIEQDIFWSQISIPDKPPVVMLVEEPLSPEGYLMAVQDVISKQKWLTAEQLCDQLLQEHPELPTSQRYMAYQLKGLSLINQLPLPAKRAEAWFTTLASERAFRDETLWNLGVRLWLSQVVDADGGEAKNIAWRDGVARFYHAAEKHGLRASTLSDLDQFLYLSADGTLASGQPETTNIPAIEPLEVLDVFLSMGLNVGALRELNRRKIRVLSRSGQADAARDNAWHQLVLNSVPSGDPLSAVNYYEEVSLSVGGQRIYPDLIEPESTEVAWSKTTRSFIPSSPTTTHDSLHRRMTHGIVYGPPSDGIVAAQHALANSTVVDIWEVFDTLGMIAVSGTRDLRQASEPLRWHLRQITPSQTDAPPLPPEAGNLGDRLSAAWQQARASVKTDHGDNFVLQSEYVQGLILRRQLKRWAEANASWAFAALENDQPELSALFWGQAVLDATLADDPSDSERAIQHDAVEALATVLRALDNKDLAVEMIGRVDRELSNPRAREPVLFLGATLLYEQGRMSDCLLALDRVEALNPSWDESKQIAAGLIRAVAQLKLGRLQDAESVLTDLSEFNGENEVMAQVAFLRGWIHLNRNETQPALERFRDLVETYPGTSYATKTRELIRRLEQSTAANN